MKVGEYEIHLTKEIALLFIASKGTCSSIKGLYCYNTHSSSDLIKCPFIADNITGEKTCLRYLVQETRLHICEEFLKRNLTIQEEMEV